MPQVTAPFMALGRLQICPEPKNQINPVKSAYSSSKGYVSPAENVEESMSVWAVEAKKGSGIVQNAVNQKTKPASFFTKSYWQRMLPLVYSKQEAANLFEQLCNGGAYGQMPARQQLYLLNKY